MSEKSPMPTDEQLLALTALAAKDPVTPVSCPPDDQLAAFIDGELKGAARNAMLAHLNQCDVCRQHWLEVAAVVSAEEPEPAPATAQGANLLTYLLDALKFLCAPRGLALAATAVVVISLAINLAPTSDLTQRVDAQFAAANPDAAALASVAQNMPLPWESAALGFGDQSTGNANRAFGAGVWQGRARLSDAVPEDLPEALSAPDPEDWSDTPWNPHYQFGRWATLLWARLSADQEIDNWDEHLSIVGNLRAEISASAPDAQVAQRALTTLDEQLEKLAVKPSDIDYQELRQRLLLTIQQLSPTAL